ncbi:hypothetical protein JM64_01535 [Fervidobacterium ngatamarikiense]|uniref:Uncharacterized protein n=1 Tax=Fervidobacterium pennivorans TaxID=93466 RepID=A0A172T1G1_FERPE|nr:hypothetical protein JM64_01535 [Fervidobacterium pennivorans]
MTKQKIPKNRPGYPWSAILIQAWNWSFTTLLDEHLPKSTVAFLLGVYEHSVQTWIKNFLISGIVEHKKGRPKKHNTSSRRPFIKSQYSFDTPNSLKGVGFLAAHLGCLPWSVFNSMATEVWFKPHSSDGCQSRYYLEFFSKIPLQNVYRAYSVPVISKSATLAFIVPTICMILVATYWADRARIFFWDKFHFTPQYLCLIMLTKSIETFQKPHYPLKRGHPSTNS